jgi:hypothetical protein
LLERKIRFALYRFYCCGAVLFVIFHGFARKISKKSGHAARCQLPCLEQEEGKDRRLAKPVGVGVI